MALNHFKALVTAFTAGFILCGCASQAMSQQSYYPYHQSNQYANSGPAYTQGVDENGNTYLIPNQQGQRYQNTYPNQQGQRYQNTYPQQYQYPNQYPQTYYNTPYNVQPRAPYGYEQKMVPSYDPAGVLLGGMAGNAASRGNAATIAAGAVAGGVLLNDNPCAPGVNAGTVVGAVAGYALGKQVGQGQGSKAAAVIGALVGGNVGGNMDAPKKPNCP